VFCGAAPGNIENRGHTSDYYERMRIKTEHLPRAYLKKGLAGKEKQPPGVGKSFISVEFFRSGAHAPHVLFAPSRG
jgi:hypothetical protein